MNKDITVYFDMDGVLCDFYKKFLEYVPEIQGTHDEWTDENWVTILQIEDFWESLELIPDIMELWNYAYKRYNVEILSAPSRHDKRSVTGKGNWLNNHLGDYIFNINLTGSHKKRLFADSNSILIDDMIENVDQFREDGGYAILFKNPKQALEELKEICSTLM